MKNGEEGREKEKRRRLEREMRANELKMVRWKSSSRTSDNILKKREKRRWWWLYIDRKREREKVRKDRKSVSSTLKVIR